MNEASFCWKTLTLVKCCPFSPSEMAFFSSTPHVVSCGNIWNKSNLEMFFSSSFISETGEGWWQMGWGGGGIEDFKAQTMQSGPNAAGEETIQAVSGGKMVIERQSLHPSPLSHDSYFFEIKTKQQSHHIKPWLGDLSNSATHIYWKQTWLHILCGYFCYNYIALTVFFSGEKKKNQMRIGSSCRSARSSYSQPLNFFVVLFNSPSSCMWYGS